MLDHIDSLTATIIELAAEIDTAIARLHPARRRLSSIPGVSQRVAEVIIAETGGNLSRFATPQRLASWAGMCPGNNESAGKHFSGVPARAIEGYVEHSVRPPPRQAGRKTPTCPGATDDCRLVAAKTRDGRRGSRHPAGRVVHPRPRRGLPGVGAHYFDLHVMDPRRKGTRLAQQLQALGYRVTFERAA
ncbi:MAG: IS110 family transposase [Actinomycetota bacterium]|nr:IS110 family transposase [Actinomycetota bacterium]MDQ3899842.1 IS110 family transposase [Actinomycetota bacterium]